MLEMGLSGSEGGVALNPPSLPLSKPNAIILNRGKEEAGTAARNSVRYRQMNEAKCSMAATGTVEAIRTAEELETLLSEPAPYVVETFRRVPGDILVLGVSGKMGPTLARMAKRAAEAAGSPRRVIGVSRFLSSETAAQLEAHGIETNRCDMLDEDAIARLPDVPNVIFMAGSKFGTTGNEARMWAMNSHVPGVVCRRFRQSRLVVFSTGNVYGQAPVEGGGSLETDPPNPVGEYAMSGLGRERICEYFSRTWKIPLVIFRLNYACELRYGVLVDLALKIWRGEPVDLRMGHFNTIWQGDANAMALAALAHAASPPLVLNVTGPEQLSVRAVCERFGQWMGKTPAFTGREEPTALLNNARRAFELFGRPRIGVDPLMWWIAEWIMRGGASLGKPTHFESGDGKY